MIESHNKRADAGRFKDQRKGEYTFLAIKVDGYEVSASDVTATPKNNTIVTTSSSCQSS
jgi:hypothetical protein